MTHEVDHTATAQTLETAVKAASDAAVEVVTWWEWAARTGKYIQSTFVSIIFFLLFVSLVIWIIRLNIGNGTYQHFRLADMVMRKDGTIDRKAMERTMLFLASLYGFLYVVHKHEGVIVGYLVAMAGIWLGYQLADNKLTNKGAPAPNPEILNGPQADPAAPATDKPA